MNMMANIRLTDPKQKHTHTHPFRICSTNNQKQSHQNDKTKNNCDDSEIVEKKIKTKTDARTYQPKPEPIP